mgnify:CR=1 FL=1
MALIVGNKQIQSIVPRYNGAGVLEAILVRVNRSIVDDSTVPPTVKHGLSTSREIDILSQLTPTQATAARAFMARLSDLISSMVEFEE